MINDRDFSDILRVDGINAKGYGTVPKLVMQDRRLTRDARLIYCYFCSFAGNGNTAFPSVKRICYDLCYGNEDTFRKHFKLLKKFDYIRVQQLKNNGKFSKNIYTLIINPVQIINENIEPSPKFKGTEKTVTQISGAQKKRIRLKWGTKRNSILKKTINKKINQSEIKNDGLIDSTFDDVLNKLKAENDLTESEISEIVNRTKNGAKKNHIEYLKKVVKNFVEKERTNKSYSMKKTSQFRNFKERKYDNEDYLSFYKNEPLND